MKMKHTKFYDGIEILELANKKELPKNVLYRDRYGNFYFSSGSAIIHLYKPGTNKNPSHWDVPTYLQFLDNDFIEVESGALWKN